VSENAASLLEALRALVKPWLAGEAIAIRSRRVLALSMLASTLALAYATGSALTATRRLRTSPRAPALPADRCEGAQRPRECDQGDVRFGVPLAKRRAVFARLAASEPGERNAGKNEFPGPGLEWSAEDHRAAFERAEVAAVMSEQQLEMSQVYLILDEGIREHWPAPNGKALDPYTVPLHPRRSYGW
jgi:hypothetical protein